MPYVDRQTIKQKTSKRKWRDQSGLIDDPERGKVDSRGFQVSESLGWPKISKTKTSRETFQSTKLEEIAATKFCVF